MDNCQFNYTKKDFVSNQEVKWCPGCGDYAILASFQQAMTKINIKKENIVCVSGIGCSSRFPYYVDSYGYHTIHGRAPAIASGIKISNPELSVWVITGDGDGLSIGGNHLIHLMRRNIDINVIMFNNEIYGLTKGQFSPTTKIGKVTKTSPSGVQDAPFQPIMMVLAAGATFIARTNDKEIKMMTEIMVKSASHKGSSFIEILQNCVIFNHGTHDQLTLKNLSAKNTITVEHGKPMIFGEENEKCLVRKNELIISKDVEELTDKSKILVFDKTNKSLLFQLLVAEQNNEIPHMKGILYESVRVKEANESNNSVSITNNYIENFILAQNTWTVK